LIQGRPEGPVRTLPPGWSTPLITRAFEHDPTQPRMLAAFSLAAPSGH
jgi:hypothetical protein